jgi:hypothetical protein
LFDEGNVDFPVELPTETVDGGVHGGVAVIPGNDVRTWHDGLLYPTEFVTKRRWPSVLGRLPDTFTLGGTRVNDPNQQMLLEGWRKLKVGLADRRRTVV